MNREFLVNIIFLVIINLLIKPFYIFGIDRGVQNLVGEQQYGIYYTLFSFAFLFQTINDLGIQNYNTRVISQNEQLLDKYFSNILTLKLFLAFFYFIIIIVAAWVIGYQWAWFPMLLGLGFNNVLLAMVIYLRSNISSLGMYRTNSILTVLDKIFMIILCSILLWVEPFKSHFQIEWFVHAQNFTLILTVIIAFFITFKKIKHFKITFDFPFLKQILRGALPFALVFFLMTVYTRLDTVMLERLLPDGVQQAGIYASAYRLLDAVNMFGFFFAGILMPMFSKLLKNNEPVAPLVRLSFQIIYVGSIIVATVVFFYRYDIMHLLYVEATPFSADVLGVLIFSFIAISGIYIYSTLLGMNDNTAQMNRVFLITIVLNVLLNAILIPPLKAYGAALTTCFTQFFTLFMLIFLSKKHLQLRGDMPWILKLISFTIAVFLIVLSVKSILKDINWIAQMIVSVSICGILSLIMGFFNYKKIEHLLKQNAE
jgi:O-antigen/teichoic acid export membrane protein